jgi:hypothetical protein
MTKQIARTTKAEAPQLTKLKNKIKKTEKGEMELKRQKRANNKNGIPQAPLTIC